MPKIKHIPGLSQISCLKSSPRVMTQNRQSVTQPQTHRAYIEVECDKKECLQYKFSQIAQQKQILQLQLDVTKYQSLYVKERKKLGDTYKEIEKIMKGIQSKNIELTQLELKLKSQQQELSAISQSIQNEQQLLQFKQQELQKQKQEMLDQQLQIEKQKQEDITKIDEFKLIKQTLQEQIEYLNIQQSNAELQLKNTIDEESNALRNVGHMNQCLLNFKEHQENLMQIEQMVLNRSVQHNNIQQSVLMKCEELAYHNQQLQLKDMCASLNENAFQKKLEIQTERVVGSNFKTPKQTVCIAAKIRQFFKNQEPENQIISTIGSRETSLSPKESFKLIKKNPYNTARQSNAMLDIQNNIQRFGS